MLISKDPFVNFGLRIVANPCFLTSLAVKASDIESSYSHCKERDRCSGRAMHNQH